MTDNSLESEREKLKAFEGWFIWFVAVLVVNVGVLVGLSDFVDASVGADWKIDSEAQLLLRVYLEMYTKTVFSDRGITVLELVSE